MNNGLKISEDFSLLNYNTFGINCIARRFVKLDNEENYRTLLQADLLSEHPFFVLGGGSNVVFPDQYEGVVVHPANNGVRLVESANGQCLVEAGAGEVWAEFVDHCIDNGWSGLENMAAIPGTVGAAPVQNVGAYGKEAKDAVVRVHVFDIQTAEERWIEASECQFGYRWSGFKGEWKNRFLIDKVVFRLNEMFVPDISYKALATALTDRGLDNPTARQLADTVAAVRDSKLPNPKVIGSAGSFFKNPVVGNDTYERIKASNPDIVAFPVGNDSHKLAAGWLIEHSGWKGRTVGRVGVYEKQALVLVNRGQCTGQEVRNLANEIIADIEARFGVRLECEAIFV